jgi:DNA-binding NarL/FixJ family response regulator
VVIGNARQTIATQPHGHVVRLTSEEAYLYATYHDVSVIVLDVDTDRIQLVRSLRTIFPSTAVIAFSRDPAKIAAAAKAGAIAGPPSSSTAKLDALIAHALAVNRARG